MYFTNMPYKSGKLKGELTTAEIRKLIRAHNKLVSIKIPPKTDRDGLLSLLKKHGYKVDHEKKEIRATTRPRKPNITLKQAEGITKPEPLTEEQKKKRAENKKKKEEKVKKREGELIEAGAKLGKVRERVKARKGVKKTDGKTMSLSEFNKKLKEMLGGEKLNKASEKRLEEVRKMVKDGSRKVKEIKKKVLSNDNFEISVKYVKAPSTGLKLETKVKSLTFSEFESQVKKIKGKLKFEEKSQKKYDDLSEEVENGVVSVVSVNKAKYPEMIALKESVDFFIRIKMPKKEVALKLIK